MLCIKEVGNVKCQYCQSETIKFGKTGTKQRYRCKKCNKIQLADYKKHAYAAEINSAIAAHVKEGSRFYDRVTDNPVAVFTNARAGEVWFTDFDSDFYQSGRYSQSGVTQMCVV